MMCDSLSTMSSDSMHGCVLVNARAAEKGRMWITFHVNFIELTLNSAARINGQTLISGKTGERNTTLMEDCIA